MMPDYTFYIDAYLGTRIPEKHFNRCAARAREALARLERCYQVTGGTQARSLALCAMAEAIYEARGGMISASVGSLTVRYQDAVDRQLWRELYHRAGIYLDICRGVAT